MDQTTRAILSLALTLSLAQLGLGSNFDVANFIPTVAVDKQPKDSSVGVEIPAVMNLNNENQPGKSVVDLSVLGGLVTVFTNKTAQPNGRPSGPVTVSVFGIPVYVGQHSNSVRVGRVESEPIPSSLVSKKEESPKSLSQDEMLQQLYALVKRQSERLQTMEETNAKEREKLDKSRKDSNQVSVTN